MVLSDVVVGRTLVFALAYLGILGVSSSYRVAVPAIIELVRSQTADGPLVLLVFGMILHD